jgi:hypothetical protein
VRSVAVALGRRVCAARAGDDYARVVQINLATAPTPYRVIGRYRICCGYHLFDTPELEPAPIA